MSTTTNLNPLRLLTLYEVSNKINSELNLEKLLDEIMDQAIALLKAQKGLILLKDRKTANSPLRSPGQWIGKMHWMP